MKKALVLLPLLLLVIGVACGGVSATQVERDLYSKLDKGDVAGALALTTEDAVFEVLGCPQGGCKGKEAVKGAFEGIVAQHPRHTIKSSKDSKNTAASQVEAELDLAKAAGVQRIVAKVTVELKDDKIARFGAQFDTTDQQTASVVNFVRLSGILRQHYEAVNKGDVAATVAFFTDDAVLARGALCPAAKPCVGKAAIQRQADVDRSDQLQFTLTNIQVSGDTVTARAERRGNPEQAAGVERHIQNQTITFRGDQISRLTFETDLSDPQTATFANFARVGGTNRRREDSLHRGDVAAVMATFTDDAVFGGFGLCASAPCVGKAAIQKEIEREVADKTKFTAVPLTARVSGNTWTGKREIRSDSIQAAGVERVLASMPYEVPKDQISSLRYELDATDPQTATVVNFQRLVGIVQRYSNARRLGNVAGVMAALTEDAVFEGYGLCAAAPCSGKAAIQKEIERQVADKTNTTPIGGAARVTGDIFTSRVEFRSDSIKAAGVERILFAVTVEAKGDKVSLYRWVPDSTDPQTATYLKSQVK